MQSERVSFSAGVPTIWIGILALLDQHPGKWDLSAMRTMLDRRLGGASVDDRRLSRARHGLIVTHAWGMTETNPMGSIARIKRSLAHLDDAAKLQIRASQGFAAPFVETRHVSEDGRVLPRDGVAMGELEVRGPWVARAYLGGDGAEKFTADGWFKTGDVVTIDGSGYLRITDRSKDVIKSGGEWISSVALEGALMAHPAVPEAAVFGARHLKWDERPGAAVVLRPGNDRRPPTSCARTFRRASSSSGCPTTTCSSSRCLRTSTGKFQEVEAARFPGNCLIK